MRQFLALVGSGLRVGRMASGVAERMEQRAAEAEQLIIQLREQVNVLKTNAVKEACRLEGEQLMKQNSALRKEVAHLKNRLIQAEIANGVPQIPVPVKDTNSVTRESGAPAKAPEKYASQGLAKAEQKQQQPKKEKKKGEAKPKEKQAKSEEVPADASRLNMRIGFIVSAKKHPDADGLYVEEVDVGEEKPRTIVSGLVKHVSLEEMQQRYAIFLLNLKPAKMRGIFSHGMIMCGSSPEKVEIINPPEGVTVGEPVIVDGYQGTPDVQLNPKKKVWEQIQPDLGINSEGLAHYKGALWRVEGKGTCKVPTMRDTPVK